MESVLHSRRTEWITAALLAAAVACLVLILGDLKKAQFVVLVLGLTGLLVLAALPNRRIVLVGIFAFLHPLNVQKVIQIAETQHVRFLPPFYSVSASDIALFLLIAELLRESLTTTDRRLYWPKAATPLALLFAWAVLEFFLLHPSMDGILQLAHWFKLLVALVVFSSAIRTRHELLLVFAIMSLSLLLQSAVVFATFITHRTYSVIQDTDFEATVTQLANGSIRATGTTGGANQQAQYHTFLTIPLLGLCWLRNWFWRGTFMLVIGASFTACTLTFCRAAWLTWALAGGVMLILAIHQKLMNRRLWTCVAACALAGAIGLVAAAKPIINRFGKDDDGASVSRLRMIHTALGYIGQYPVTGVGPGNFVEHQLDPNWKDALPNRWRGRDRPQPSPYMDGVEMMRYEWRNHMTFMTLAVHNKYLLVASELGAVGLALFLWYEWSILRECFIAMRATHPLARWTGIALCAAVCASLFFFLFDLFYHDITVITVIYMNALAVAGGRITARELSLET